MLDIGFRDDIRRILRKIEADHQTIFVSATLDEEIRKLARAFMKEPIELNVSGDELTVENIEHGFVPVDPQQKFSNLLGYLKHEVPKLAIVFTNTKHAARRVAEKLRKEGINCQEIHGDLHQSKREKVMAKFRKSAIQVLVATDLASRGLDVMEVSHIVNYDAPADPAAYVHRIGRTARMGNRGYAVTFITREEGDLLTGIEMLLNKEVPQFTTPWHIPPALPEGPDHVEEPTPEDAPPSISTRYQETYKKDELLESIGVRPVRRTLGSRFRTTRRRR
jgi:ATP-dependent RNA helicase DeaD